MTGVLLALCCSFSLAQPRAREELSVSPVQISGGPILLVTAQKEFVGDTLYLVDPTVELRPQPLSTTSYVMCGFHRLDREHLLVETFDNLYLVHLAKGVIEPLAKDGRKLKLMTVEGNTYYCLEVIKEFSGEYSLEGDRVKEAPEPAHRLCVMRNEGMRAVETLDKAPIQSVLDASKDHFWVLRGAPLALWRISKDGRDQRKAFVFPDEIVPSLCTHAFSPDGKRLAYGLATRASFFKFRDLIVIDLEAGKEIFKESQIHVEVSSLSSLAPRLAFTWLDNDRIRFSETKLTSPKGGLDREGYFQWVDVNLKTGKRIAEKKYTEELELWHGRRPVVPRMKAAIPEGLFEWGPTGLQFRGAKLPLHASLGEGKVYQASIAPGGQWAAFVFFDEERQVSCLADGKTNKVTRLIERTSGLVWLPGK